MKDKENDRCLLSSLVGVENATHVRATHRRWDAAMHPRVQQAHSQWMAREANRSTQVETEY